MSKENKGCAIVNPLFKQSKKESSQISSGIQFDIVPKDFRLDFQTPIPVCKYMVSLLPETVVSVLEPSQGIGNMVNQLKDYTVTAPTDFFLLDKTQRFDAVVMNPPFSDRSAFLENAPANFDGKGMRLGYHFLTECMKMSDNVIALMPWFTLTDSDLRLRTMKRFGLKSLTALPRKTFQYARIQTVVIQLEKGYQGETKFKIFDF